MKTIIRFSLIAITFSLVLATHAASLNWATVETVAATGDTSPGLANAASYSAYYLTAEATAGLFKSTSIATIANYLKANYETGRSGVAANGVALKAGNYGVGQYSFTEYSASAVAGKDYVAIVFYDNAASHEFRIFGVDSAAVYDTSVVFDDLTSAAGTFSTWTTPDSGSVPEPTSGLLLLVGFAGLALKRKHMIV